MCVCVCVCVCVYECVCVCVCMCVRMSVRNSCVSMFTRGEEINPYSEQDVSPPLVYVKVGQFKTPRASMEATAVDHEACRPPLSCGQSAVSKTTTVAGPSQVMGHSVLPLHA